MHAHSILPSAMLGLALVATLTSALAACADSATPERPSAQATSAHALEAAAPATPSEERTEAEDEAAELEARFLAMSEDERRAFGREVLAEHEVATRRDWVPRAVSRPMPIDDADAAPCTTPATDDDRATDDETTAVAARESYTYRRPDEHGPISVPAHVRGGEIIMPTPDPELGALFEDYRAEGCESEEREALRGCAEHPYRRRVEERRAEPTARAIAALEAAEERGGRE